MKDGKGKFTLKIGGLETQVDSLEEASELYSTRRDASGLGSSRWPDGYLTDNETGDEMHISYNGKIWPGTEYDPGAEFLYSPVRMNNKEDTMDEQQAISRDRLERVLLEAGLELERVKDNVGFWRDVRFSVRGKDYEIEWYKNVSYLTTGELKVVFTDMEYSGTWPNRFKKNLQFRHLDHTVCIVPVDEYPDLVNN